VDGLFRKHPNNLVIIVESAENPHKQIIQSTVAKRAYQIFEKRGCKHGCDLEDWVTAEKELLRDDFDGNTFEFHVLLECPRDPEVTTILSLTTHSLVVFRSHTRLFGKPENRSDVLSVHVLPEEIDPTQADVKAWMDCFTSTCQRRTTTKSDLDAHLQQVSELRAVNC
jgi:hypothetical protein